MNCLAPGAVLALLALSSCREGKAPDIPVRALSSAELMVAPPPTTVSRFDVPLTYD